MNIALGVVAGIMLLFVLRRAYLGWRIPAYAPGDVAEKRKMAGVVVLDVRTSDERARSRIDGSLHIPIGDLRSRIGQMEKHRQKEIICYCQTGSRSLAAAALLQKHGFRAANMKGGMAEWNFQRRS